MNESHGRVFGLDLLRALAISLVLFSHFLGIAEPLGVIGVELFFVLSGFLVGGIFLKLTVRTNSITFPEIIKFWKRRWWRTLPNYFLFLLIFSTIALLTNSLPPLTEYLTYLLFLQNWLWSPFGFFGVSWSLAIEEWFYLLMPLTILGINRLGLNVKLSFLIGCLLMGLASFSLRFFLFDHGPWDATARKICLGRLDSLACGCLMAYLHQEHRKYFVFLKKPLIIGLLSCALLLAVAAIFHGYPDKSLGLRPSVFFALTPIVIAGLLPAIHSINCNLPPLTSLITNISLWSYSLYLIHSPILTLARTLGGDSGPIWAKLGIKATCLALSFAGAAFIYKKFEVPLTKLRPHQ